MDRRDSQPATPDAARRPQPPERRLVTVDALRGFAILGILLVNSTLYLHPAMDVAVGFEWPSPLDRIVASFVAFFAEAKFFTTFSFLFGLGVILQGRRLEARGEDPGPLARRRLVGLLGFGIAHVVLLWWGDILVYYAVLGFILVAFFRTAPAPRLRRAAQFSFAVPVVLTLLYAGFLQLGQSTPEGAATIEETLAQSVAEYQAMAQEAERIYSGNDFWAMAAQRVQDWSFTTMGMLFAGSAFLVFGMFLLGAWAGRLELFDRVSDRTPLLRRLFVFGVLLGVGGNVLYLVLGPGSQPIPTDAASLFAQLGYLLGAPALSLAYISGLTLYFASGRGAALQRALAAVGRMTLSNYLLQSLVMTTLAYGYGAGLYGRVGPAVAVAIALALFATQVLISLWWTRRFRFGPLEWLWRWFTYGSRPELLVQDSPPRARP